MRKSFYWLVMFALGLAPAMGELSLASPFTDYMVFQRGKKIPIWGKTDVGHQVIVEFAGQKKRTMSDARGEWRVSLDSMDASSDGQELIINSGGDRKILKDILIGDVWIATGQSNMSWTLKQSTGGCEAVAASDDAGLRLFQHTGTLHPGGKKYDVQFIKKVTVANYYATSGWQQSGPQSSAGFSGVAYFFGKKLRDELKVPIGLINFAVGGTPIEAHISPEVMKADVTLRPLLKEWWKNNDYPLWCRQRAALNLTHWLSNAELRRKEPPHPFAPHFLWDAGIARYLPLPVKGVIWYQGESNATVDGAGGAPVDGALNKKKFKALVKSWRKAWCDEDLPIYHVQLPGLNRNWPVFREMQFQVSQEFKNIGMAVTIDVGHPTNVHPQNKQPVGERLARLALAGVYGQDIVPNGPLYKRSIATKGGSMIVDFENGEGLKASDGKEIRGFELADSQQKFHLAKAVLQGEYLQVSSAEVAVPTAVRYAWANNPDCNLVNSEGLPASPFRTDKWNDIKPSGNVDMESKITTAVLVPHKKEGVIRVACIGDSITYGSGIPTRDTDSYPAVLQGMLGGKYEVRNFGNPGRGILKKSKRGRGKRAYIFMPEHAQAIKFEPHIVVCNLGINDIMDWGRFGKAEFVPNYRELIQAYKTLDTYPRVIIWHKLAPLFKGQKFFGDPQIDALNVAIARVAKLESVEMLDMSVPFVGKGSLFPDHIHPNAEGAKIIAQKTMEIIMKK